MDGHHYLIEGAVKKPKYEWKMPINSDIEL